METTPFDLTSEQKGLLVALAQETGKPIPALLAAALEELQKHVHSDHAHERRHKGQHAPADADLPLEDRPPMWERFEEASRMIPDTELDRLPTDLAAQVDHYIYGTPKR